MAAATNIVKALASAGAFTSGYAKTAILKDLEYCAITATVPSATTAIVRTKSVNFRL
jgi:hypothetical protein